MKGKFSPRNPQKYDGDPTGIVYRSSWELKVMLRLDEAADVAKWSSEEVVVRYRSPVDGRVHRYFPDFIVHLTSGRVQMLEVKPHKQTVEPRRKLLKGGRPTRAYVAEVMEYGKNTAKWAAAREFCAARDWEFKTLTEYDLGIKPRPTRGRK